MVSLGLWRRIPRWYVLLTGGGGDDAVVLGEKGENLHSSWLVAQSRVSLWRGCFGAGF